MNESSENRSVPKYAQGTFDRELNYKLWSTYKARFNAADRLNTKHRLSTRAIALLSSYVAIFSVITAVFEDTFGSKQADVLLIIGVSLSILILVLGLLETSQNYSLKADRFHQSGLDIAELYKELRSLKSKHEEKDKAFFEEIDSIRTKHNDILQRSENHEIIDHECFLASKPYYVDHDLDRKAVKKIHRKLFWTQYAPYYFAIFVPPLVFGLFLMYSIKNS